MFHEYSELLSYFKNCLIISNFFKKRWSMFNLDYFLVDILYVK